MFEVKLKSKSDNRIYRYLELSKAAISAKNVSLNCMKIKHFMLVQNLKEIIHHLLFYMILIEGVTMAIQS